MQFFNKWMEKIRKYFSTRGYVCDGCGVEVFDYPAQRLCAGCERKMYYNNGRTCEKCGRQTVADGVCLLCKQKLPAFTKGISPFVYRGESASLVNRIKNGKRRLAYYFAEKMADALVTKYSQISQFDRAMSALKDDTGSVDKVKTIAEDTKEVLLVLPVPMTVRGVKERGFNQAAELSKALIEELKKRGYAAELDLDVLQKRKETAPQKKMSFSERAENLVGAYHVHKRTRCKDRVIVLVDDIMTTGATGNECAERLLGAGAKEVLLLAAVSLPERR